MQCSGQQKGSRRDMWNVLVWGTEGVQCFHCVIDKHITKQSKRGLCEDQWWPVSPSSSGHLWSTVKRNWSFLISVQFSSVSQSCPTLWNPMDCSTPGFPVHQQLPELAQTHVHQVGYAIQTSHSLFSPSPPAFNLSQHWILFQWVSSSNQVAKVLEFRLQHPSFQWIFRTDFLSDWLVWSCSPRNSQSLLQHHSSKASILWRSAFFIVQLSHPYMTTGKTIALIRWTFVGKVMSLLFNMLSRLVITLSKRLLISRLRSPSAVILESKK